MIKYCIRKSGYAVSAEIEEVEVERETESSVWIDGLRFAKRSECYNYYGTWAEAKAALLKNQQLIVNSLKLSLQIAEERLGNVADMKQEQK
jgi:hypothetical protein